MQRPLRAVGKHPPHLPRKGHGGTLQGLTKMLLDSVQDVHAVLAVNHVHGQAPLAKAAGAPDPVQVGLIVWVPILVHGKIKIDDDRHLFNIDTCVKGVGDRRESGMEKVSVAHSQATALSLAVRETAWVRPPLGCEDTHWHVAEARGEKKSVGRCQHNCKISKEAPADASVSRYG